MKSPRRGTTFDRVYGYYVDSGHAELLLRQCLELTTTGRDGPDAAKAWLLLGLLHERRGEPGRAAMAFEKSAHLDPSGALAPFYLGEQLAGQAKYPAAIDALEESLRRKPPRGDLRSILQTLGRVVWRTGNADKAEEVWSRLERLDPDDIDIPLQIAESLESEGRDDEALERYRRLTARPALGEADRTRLTLAIAEILLRQGKDKQALDEFDALLDRLAPESWLAESVRNRVERLFVRRGDDRGLAEFYRQRLEKQPEESETVRRLAQTLLRLRESEEARELLLQTLQKSPSNVSLRLALIDLLLRERHISDALEQYREIDRLDPGVLRSAGADYLAAWGVLALQDPKQGEEGRKREAVRIWQRLVDATPGDPLEVIRVADLANQYDLSNEAEKRYRQAVELKPDSPTYREYLGLFYHQKGRKAEAVETLRSMAEGSRRSLETLMQAGSILQSLGYANEASAMFEDAVRLAPKDLSARWKYAESLFQRRDFDAALLQWTEMERLIEKDEDFDAFLRRELRFLQASSKLKTVADTLAERLKREPETGRPRVRGFWRLALYRQAEGKPGEAVKAMEQALDAASPSNRLLQSAAELFEQNGRGEKALELYRDLVEHDGVWRIEHLKHLATLQIQLGQVEQAFETGRRLLGSGSAGNIRFYAELLLNHGRREEGIAVLRQALRVEPGNVSVLKLLAANLAETGKTDEAIEIAWRLFERTETTSGKLDIATLLAEYYRKAGRPDALLERLRERKQAVETRRESMLCLARVHLALDGFDDARKELESLLTMTTERDDDTPALRLLVFASEKQGDLPAAVRYQEMLCNRTQGPSDFDRLFVLYDRNGDRDKARDLFLRRILLKPTLAGQLESIDRMIRREEYEAVERVLSFLEIHDAMNWEIPFRRLALASYQNEEGIDELVRDFREMSFPDENKPATEASMPTGEEHVTQPWLLPNFPPDAEPFLATLFRDRLRRNEHYRSPNDVPPPKPFLDVDRFQEARFLALGWWLKATIDEDAASESGHYRRAVEEIRAELPDGSPERQRFERMLRDVDSLLGR